MERIEGKSQGKVELMAASSEGVSIDIARRMTSGPHGFV